MMKSILSYFHTFLICLIQPGKVHQWLKYDVAPWNDDILPPKPSLAPSISASWVMAIVQGLGKIALASIILKFLIQFQQESALPFALIEGDKELIPYYFLIISTSLDIIFFPVLMLVVTQLWNLIIRAFGWMLGIEKSERQGIADDITVVALSSNFFLVLPIAGIFLQKLAWLYLMYVGLRKNLGASRSLSIVILFTPTLILSMIFGVLTLGFFYLLKTSV